MTPHSAIVPDHLKVNYIVTKILMVWAFIFHEFFSKLSIFNSILSVLIEHEKMPETNGKAI